MGTQARWLTAAAVLMLGTPATAAAQDPSSEFDSWRAPGWTFVPSLTFGTIYDSNVALATAPSDTRRTESDELLFASPSGQIEYLGRRTEFSTGYRGSVRRYTSVNQLNSFDQRVFTSFRRLVTKRVSLSLQNAFVDVPTTDEVQLNGAPFVSSGVQSNSFNVELSSRLSRYADLALRYGNTWVDFDRKENFLTGGWVNGFSAELSRRLSDRTSFGGEYGFRIADLNEGTRELMFHDAGARLRHSITDQTSFTLSGGISRVEDKLVAETRNGPYFRTSITRTVERSTIGAFFHRQFVPSFGFGGSSTSQELSAFVHMPVTRSRAYVRASAAWLRSDPLIEEQELKLDSGWIRSTVGYAVLRWLRTELFYGYTRQDSEITGGEIDRHRAGVQVVVSQPMRIR